jgi:hypothetical protein
MPIMNSPREILLQVLTAIPIARIARKQQALA